MKARHPSELGRSIMRFFQEYLPVLRGMSLQTIRSYRDGLVLLLQFVAGDVHRRIESLQISDLSAERVGRFLRSLETERKNGIATRNARLAAIHTFARFLVAEHPEYMESLQRILGIPFKRGALEAPVEYLEKAEIDALLDGINRRTWSGQRDYALFALMINTGARVQEILNLQVRDLRLDPPCLLRLHGKGNKVRFCPIWPRMAQLLRALISTRSGGVQDPATQPVFVNRQGNAMTRFGVRYLLRKHVAAAARKSSSLAHKRIHPHSLRHTTAVCMLKAGIDFPTVSELLGHASIDTTMRYTRSDIDLKRQALAQVFPDVLAPPKGGAYRFTGADLTGWLRRL